MWKSHRQSNDAGKGNRNHAGIKKNFGKIFLPFPDKQYLPAGQTAVNEWLSKDAALKSVTKGIIKVLDDIKAEKWEEYFE